MNNQPAAAFETISYHKAENGVATIVLNRPERLNAFNQQMLEEIRTAWRCIGADQEVRSVIVRAAGERAFCSGVDIVDSIDEPPDCPFEERDVGEALGPKQNLVWKPVITAVHGLCAGGAFYILNESDIIICETGAQFFDPHVSFGLVPACEPVGASHRMPYGEIMRMILLGNDERIGAETALRIGLVSEVVQRDQLVARAEQIAGLIAGKPTSATQGAVRAMWESLDMPYSTAVKNSYKYTQIGNRAARLRMERGQFKKPTFTVR